MMWGDFQIPDDPDEAALWLRATLDDPETAARLAADRRLAATFIARATTILGRGACDTKNNLVMLVEAIRFLREAGIPLWRTPILDLPIEEEIGGNGTLNLLLHNPSADEAVCLEPTGLQVLRGHRGCLSFQVDVHGRSVHMGSTGTGLDAIAGAIDVIAALRQRRWAASV